MATATNQVTANRTINVSTSVAYYTVDIYPKNNDVRVYYWYGTGNRTYIGRGSSQLKVTPNAKIYIDYAPSSYSGIIFHESCSGATLIENHFNQYKIYQIIGNATINIRLDTTSSSECD